VSGTTTLSGPTLTVGDALSTETVTVTPDNTGVSTIEFSAGATLSTADAENLEGAGTSYVAGDISIIPGTTTTSGTPDVVVPSTVHIGSSVVETPLHVWGATTVEEAVTFKGTATFEAGVEFSSLSTLTFQSTSYL
ncbi:hypothetical protein KIPB_014561, partial [Kipferlia bialata]